MSEGKVVLPKEYELAMMIREILFGPVKGLTNSTTPDQLGPAEKLQIDAISKSYALVY